MREAEIELIVQRALEAYPGASPRVISDNGPQFVADDFKRFIRLVGLTHVRTSPYYPQSNGKKERWYKTLKSEAIRKKTPLSLADAREVVASFVAYYDDVRLHSAIGYVTPRAVLEGRAAAIFEQRRTKLAAARLARISAQRQRREAAA
jgi:putative transposase